MENLNKIEPIYTLSVAARLSGVPAHSIRQYIGKGLILPFKTGANRHLFSEVDILRLKCIKRGLHEEGLNIAGIKSMYSLIPCWAIKPCTKTERENCGAYWSTSQPCWDASEKSEVCKTSTCRTCKVYRIPETCPDLKSIFRELIVQH